jgi:hypothetical protein
MAKKTKNGKVAAEIAAGLVAAGAAAAATYYFYGSKKAKAHRKVAAKWATSMKQEVIKETKRLKDVTPAQFAKVVDTVASTYQGVRSINAADVKRAANELKSNWDMVQEELHTRGTKTVARAKNVGAKTLASAKKAVKKKAVKSRKKAVTT